MPTTGRNEPCPCGSGAKYKKCCLPRDEVWQIDQRAAIARQAPGADLLFQGTTVPCECGGAMAFVPGSERSPSQEDLGVMSDAAVVFERQCTSCGLRVPSMQGGLFFGP